MASGMIAWAEKRALALRRAAWAGIAMLVAVRTALALAPLDPLVESTLADVMTYLLPMLLVVLMCAMLAVTLRSQIEGRFWGVLGMAIALVLVAESHWTWHAATIDFHGPPLHSPFRLLYVFAAVLFIGLMISMTRLPRRSPARLSRLVMDIAAGMVVAFSLTYACWSLPAAQRAGGGVVRAVQFAVYPVLGLTVWVGIFAVLVGWKAQSWRPWERIIVTSYALTGVGMVLMPLWYDSWMGTSEPAPGWMSMLMGAGMYLHFVAGIYRVTASDEEALSRAWPMPDFRARLYPVLVAAFLPLIGWIALVKPATARSPLLVAIALLAVLLVSRSWLVVTEIAHHRLRAVTDHVTGAYNEPYLRERIAGIYESARFPAALVAVEVSEYWRARDTLGSEPAGRMLAGVARIMLTLLPSGGQVFRLTEGRLVAVLEGADAAQARAYAAAVVVRGASHAAIAGPASLALFAGVANTDQAEEAETLLACAIAALGTARRLERGNVAFYDGELSSLGGTAPEPPLDLRALRETVRALAAAVDARDHATRHHSAHCAELASALAQQMGLSEERVQLIGLAALMHDVGKIGVTDEILLKEGPLTPEERLAVQEHCELGQRILAPANLGDILPLVRHHHERWDGDGYPDGLAGEEIPIEARIMAVCDAYETLTAGRPYREAVSLECALLEIQRCSGRQFDPVVVQAFEEMLHVHMKPVVERRAQHRPELATGDASA